MLANAASLVLGLSVLASSAVAAVPRSQPARFREVVTRDDWANTDHCPGGSIGDADKCTLELLTVYDTTLSRWRQYGDWYEACGSTNVGTITQTVSTSLAVGNSYTTGTSVSIGIESEGLSAGVSASFEESWSTETTVSSQQSIEVEAGNAGNINLSKKFFVAEGRIKVQYGSTKGGHYFWYSGYQDYFTLDASSGDVFSSNVQACPVEQPDADAWFYSISEYDAVKAGPSKTYTYDN